MSINRVEQEISTIHEVEMALQRASSIPYNNATNIYEAAGELTHREFGGSCLFKLNNLKTSLPVEATNVVFITSQVGETTHYAMLADIERVTYYFDPFLWQKSMLPVNAETGTEVETLQNGRVLRKESNPPGSYLTISLVDVHDPEKPNNFITHKFTDKLNFLPSSSALPLKPHLPSFMMQLPDPDGIHFYKIWYSKDKKELSDIWVTNTLTGIRRKVSREETMHKERRQIVERIETLIGISEKELCNYFSRAHELELKLSSLMSSSSHDIPHSEGQD